MSKTKELFWTFFKIGAFTFGGGYAMVALLQNEFVEEKKWVTKEEFLDMVAIAESTPGPVAVNSATYIGYKIEGTAGAAASTVAVCLPSFAVIYLISLFFDQFLRLSVVASAFHGIQVCVIYLILSAGLKMLKQLEHSVFNIVILTTVAAAMVGCSIAAVSFSSIFYICGVPAAVGAACPLPPEKGQSAIAHWDDPALCRTGDPVLGNIRISIARCLRGILLLMTASEKCAGRFPINLSGAFCYKKPGTGKLMAPCARLQLLLEFRRYAIKLQRKKQLRWKQPQKKRPQKKRPRWKQPQKKNRSPLQQRKKRSPRPQQQQKCW